MAKFKTGQVIETVEGYYFLETHECSNSDDPEGCQWGMLTYDPINFEITGVALDWIFEFELNHIFLAHVPNNPVAVALF